MVSDKHEERYAPGVVSGEFMPLTVEEFQRAYSTAVHMLAGLLPEDPAFPVGAVLKVEGMPTKTLEDTPHNRAAYAAGATFSDPDKRPSFYWRSLVVLALAEDKKYRKYVDWQAGTMHAALLAAICTVRGSMKTTTKALRSALAVEFARRLADGPDVTLPLLLSIEAPRLLH